MTMLCSEERELRQFAISKILSTRGEQEMERRLPEAGSSPTSTFKRPTSREEEATEPFITCKLTKAEREEFKKRPMEAEYFPCHTQATARALREVAAAADSICGSERRDDFIWGRAHHVELVPRINSK